MLRLSNEAVIAPRLLLRRSHRPAPPASAAWAVGWPALLLVPTEFCTGSLVAALALIVLATLAYRRTVARLRASEAALTRRMQLEEVILRASTRFIHVDLAHVDQEIDRALCELGEFAGADRAYVFQFLDGAAKMSNTHEWCRQGVLAEIQHLQDLPITRFPWVAEKMLGREVLLVPRVRDLPPEARREREEFQRERIESILLVPMALGDRVVGFIGFDSVTAEDAWSEEAVTLLQVAADAISGALARRRGEQALREGEARYRQFLQISAEGIWRLEAVPPIPTDLEEHEQAELILERTRVVEGNEAAAQSYGYAHPEDMVGVGLDELWPGEAHEVKLAKLVEFIRSGYRITDVESTVSLPDGSCRYFLSNYVGIVEGGSLVRGWGTERDITHRRQAEEALRESEQKIRAIVESTRDWIWFCDAGGVHRYSNRAVQDLLGYAPEEIVGHSIVAFMHPEDRPGAIAHMQRAVAQRSGWSALLLRWRHKNGTYRDLESAAAPAFGPGGELVGWYGADRDITERIQMQEALGRSEARLRALFAAMSDVILILDSDGRYLEVAPTKPDLLYLPPQQFLGKTLAEVFPAELADFFLDHIRCALSTKQPVPMAYTLPIGDRKVRFAAEVSPLSENSVLIVARDITTQTEQYEQLLAAERARTSLAEHLNAEINHRARNNLAMVSGLLQMQALQEPDAALALRLREAVARIRTFVDIHEKIYATGAEQVDLLEVLRQVAATLRTVFSTIGAVFSVEGESLPCRTRAATNLAVVTNELITNALKYGESGRDGRLHVVVQLLREHGQLKITVQNSGTPVRADFDAAAQPGMGLRLASDMASQHGGAFSLRPVRGGNLATLVVEEATLQE